MISTFETNRSGFDSVNDLREKRLTGSFLKATERGGGMTGAAEYGPQQKLQIDRQNGDSMD